MIKISGNPDTQQQGYCRHKMGIAGEVKIDVPCPCIYRNKIGRAVIILRRAKDTGHIILIQHRAEEKYLDNR